MMTDWMRRRRTGGLAVAALLALSAPAGAQQTAGETFRAPPNASQMVRNWDGQPYLDVLAACVGLTEAYRQVATQMGQHDDAKVATQLLQNLRKIMNERMQAANIPAEPVPPIIQQQWLNGLGTAQRAVASDPVRGVTQLGNSTRECLQAALHQERAMGRNSR